MTDQAERYDRIAKGYQEWWAPVLAPSARGLLDRLDGVISGGASSLLDVGVGTGNLSFPALERWPGVQVTAIDASREMVGASEAIADDRLTGTDRARFGARVAMAADLPFPDSMFDAAMSSFVLQLVPSRPKALREIRRVIRPGGTFGHVTWLQDQRAFAPDRIFDEMLDAFGFDEEPDEQRSGDIPSVAAAAAELRRAGFGDVVAETAMLERQTQQRKAEFAPGPIGCIRTGRQHDVAIAQSAAADVAAHRERGERIAGKRGGLLQDHARRIVIHMCEGLELLQLLQPGDVSEVEVKGFCLEVRESHD